MSIVTRARVLGLAFASICLALSPAAVQLPAAVGANPSLDASRAEGDLRNKPSANYTFYLARPDLRRCASPMCGGYFVRQVNSGLTRCANGRAMSECYVASIDWGPLAETEAKPSNEAELKSSASSSVFDLSTMGLNGALLRGSIVTKGNGNGRYGVLKVSEMWRPADDDKPYGDFYRIRDLGIRCIAAPCLTHQETKLNTSSVQKIAGVDLNEAGAAESALEQAQKAMTSSTGIIVAGGHSTVTGPAGRAWTLKASQFYLREPFGPGNSGEVKPCMKTGCSGQICSDHEVITTCEYRTEYECYKKATCERQANGECGFTKTKELTDCLARAR